MKTRFSLIVPIMTVVLALPFSAVSSLGAAGTRSYTPVAAFQSRNEINQNFTLGNGSRVKIHTINGPVHVETWDQPQADIHIVKSSRRGEAELDLVDVIIDHSSSTLDIYTRHERKEYGNSPDVQVEVDVKLPRQMELSVSGVNGQADIGAVEGRVEVSGINGRVQVSQASQELNLHGINGKVYASMNSVGGGGIRVSGINGSIELSLPSSANAEIDVTGHNGSVNSELPMTVVGEMRRNQFHATLGSGGTMINMSGINGQINFRRQ